MLLIAQCYNARDYLDMQAIGAEKLHRHLLDSLRYKKVLYPIPQNVCYQILMDVQVQRGHF